MKRILTILGLITVFASCDKIDPPFIESAGNVTDTTGVQKVLIEDFTGHRCGNCPRAHEEAAELQTLYGDKVILICVHSGFFASPLNPDYSADYRTAVGNQLDNDFDVSEYPSGMINRREVSGSPILAFAAWATQTATILAESPKILINLTNSYNSSSRTVTSSVVVEFVEVVDATLNMALYITEDSIISAQTDYSLTPNKIDNYVHRHMLRGAFAGVYGYQIHNGISVVGDTINRSYSAVLDPTWVSGHCAVIVVVFDATTNEIIQVEQKEVE